MKKILIVEDDADVASNIECVLSKEGYSVFVANNGAAGIAAAKIRTPDLIIMDIMLPDIDGGVAIEKIQEYPPCKNIPVIFLTGLMSSDEEGDNVNVGGKMYPGIGKPFDFPRLLEKIRKYVK